MPKVEVVLAALVDKVALQNMMQLYIYDFTEQWVGLSDQELGRNVAFADLNAEGRFRDFPLDAYWMEEGRVPLLIKADGRLVGLALLNCRELVPRSGLFRDVPAPFHARAHRRVFPGAEKSCRIRTLAAFRWRVRRTQSALSTLSNHGGGRRFSNVHQSPRA